MSMDSDSSTDGRWNVASNKRRRSQHSVADKVEVLASTLRNTNKNLRTVDKLLGQYKDMGEQQATLVDTLKDDLAAKCNQLNEEKRWRSVEDLSRQPRPGIDSLYSKARNRLTTPIGSHETCFKGFSSDREQYTEPRKPGSNLYVRFFDDMDADRHLHHIHQSIRDLSSEQRRILENMPAQNTSSTWLEKARLSLSDNEPMKSVDKKLESIQKELKQERQQWKQKQDEISQISSELKQALEKQKLRQSIEQEITPQRIEYTSSLARDDFRNRYKEPLVQPSSEQFSNTRPNARETFNQPLASDYNQLKYHLDENEKEKNRYQCQIQILNKDLEAKEKYRLHMADQLQGATDKCRQLEMEKHQLLLKSQDMQSDQVEANRQMQKMAQEIRDLENQLKVSEEKNEEMKKQAQETVRQLKAKNRKFENEIEKQKSSNEQVELKVQQLTKELESMQSRGSTSAMAFENLKREFHDALAVRVKMEEQVRAREVQVNELKSLSMDLKNELFDNRSVIERLERELHAANEKACVMATEKNRLEDQLHGFNSTRYTSDNVVHELRNELHQANLAKTELSSQLSRQASVKQELAAKVQDLQKLLSCANNEIQNLQENQKKENGLEASRVASLQKELSSYKSKESERLRELMVQLKTCQVEYGAELQAVRMELNDEQNCNRSLKKQLEMFKEEMKRLNDELGRTHEDNEMAQKKMNHIRHQFINNANITDEGLLKKKELEMTLLDAKEELAHQKRNYTNILHFVSEAVDSILDLASGMDFRHYRHLSPEKAQPEDIVQWMTNMKAKFDALKTLYHERQSKEVFLRNDARDVVINSEKDRQVLLTEIERKNLALDQLTSKNTGSRMSESDYDNMESVKLSENRNSLTRFPDSCMKTKRSESTDLPKNLEEREQINTRYEKLQDAVSSVRKVLSNLSGKQIQSDPDDDSAASRLQRCPEAKDTPKNKERKSVNFDETMPLQLSDEDFKSRFLPTSDLYF